LKAPAKEPNAVSCDCSIVTGKARADCIVSAFGYASTFVLCEDRIESRSQSYRVSNCLSQNCAANFQIEQSLVGFPDDRIQLQRSYDQMLSICVSCNGVHNVNWSDIQYLRTCGAGFPGPHLRPPGVHECNERRSGFEPVGSQFCTSASAHHSSSTCNRKPHRVAFIGFECGIELFVISSQVCSLLRWSQVYFCNRLICRTFS